VLAFFPTDAVFIIFCSSRVSLAVGNPAAATLLACPAATQPPCIPFCVPFTMHPFHSSQHCRVYLLPSLVPPADRRLLLRVGGSRWWLGSGWAPSCQHPLNAVDGVRVLGMHV
jgi:hypothetical protein